MSNTSVFSFIKECAKIPSFSSYEERIIPYIESVVNRIKGTNLVKVPINNLAIHLQGSKSDKTVVLTAHLDKIDHFGEGYPEVLPYKEHETELEGQLDNTVGLGVCLSLLNQAHKYEYPNLVILFSEMEESTGLKLHPERLKNAGKGLHHGMGAEKLAEYLLQNDFLPEAIITVDTTPLFKGKEGLAIYSDWWEYFDTKPTKEQMEVTEKLVSKIKALHPKIVHTNNTNDYLNYGRVYNEKSTVAVPSIALEPAIYPYHQRNEKVFKGDVLKTMDILHRYLMQV